jgi:stage III sporulation protein AB
LEEIIYTKRPFEEFCQKRITTGEFSELLIEELTRRAKRRTMPIDLTEYSFLSQDEKQFFTEYFSAFGRGDSLSQKGYFTQAGNRLESLKLKAEEECKKYVELYTKMGFLCGLALLIILI